ncbi:hypothetical protein B0H11DRAFT_1900782 [Mycena galericulata]|nr:hypothetical protein B0H11DRAFT_1900782 [Mycena galericulata]
MDYSPLDVQPPLPDINILSSMKNMSREGKISAKAPYLGLGLEEVCIEHWTGGELDSETEERAVVGGDNGSATGRAFEDDHRDGGDRANSRSEANRDGYQPSGEGAPRRADEERLEATPGAERAPGGARNGANAQRAQGETLEASTLCAMSVWPDKARGEEETHPVGSLTRMLTGILSYDLFPTIIHRN